MPQLSDTGAVALIDGQATSWLQFDGSGEPVLDVTGTWVGTVTLQRKEVGAADGTAKTCKAFTANTDGPQAFSHAGPRCCYRLLATLSSGTANVQMWGNGP